MVSVTLSEMYGKGGRLKDSVTTQARVGALGLQEALLVNTPMFLSWVLFCLLDAWVSCGAWVSGRFIPLPLNISQSVIFL